MRYVAVTGTEGRFGSHRLWDTRGEISLLHHKGQRWYYNPIKTLPRFPRVMSLD